jgi:WXG100 family type VII secretion target
MNRAMAGSFRVTPEQLQATSGQLVQGSGEIDRISDALRAAVAPLRGEDWTGEANARFEALWDQWATSARMLHEALDGVARLMQGAASNYSETEAGVQGIFRG